MNPLAAIQSPDLFLNLSIDLPGLRARRDLEGGSAVGAGLGLLGGRRLGVGLLPDRRGGGARLRLPRFHLGHAPHARTVAQPRHPRGCGRLAPFLHEHVDKVADNRLATIADADRHYL